MGPIELINSQWISNVSPLNDSFTKKEFWFNQAPLFNFEYNEDELLALALEEEFIIPDTSKEGYYKLTHREAGISYALQGGN